MSSTATEYIYFEPHVEFVLLSRGNFFNTDGAYYEPPDENESSADKGTISYLIQFSSTPCQFETAPITIQYDLNYAEDSEDVITTFITGANEDQLLAGTLPGYAYYNNVIYSTEPQLTSSFDTELEIDHGIHLKELIHERYQDPKLYHQSNQLLIRSNTTTDLQQLLYVSDGTSTAMLNATMIREIERICIPHNYNHTIAEPQYSGWGLVMLDTEVLDDIAAYGESYSTFHSPGDPGYMKNYDIYQNYTSPIPELQFETNSEFVYFFTSAPKIYLNDNPDFLYTSATTGETNSALATIDFGSLPYLIEAETVDEMDNPFILLFKHDETGSMTHLIASADLLELDLMTKEDNNSITSDKITTIHPILNVLLCDLIII